MIRTNLKHGTNTNLYLKPDTSLICHITTPDIWRQALESGYFETASLNSEGFIHCCLENQMAGVIGRYYSDLKEILILYIEEDELVAPLKYEVSTSVNESFPHVYGRINMDAVKDIKRQII